MSYICYILRSLNPKYFNRTYTGITNNSVRRLRQHNGELVGGARCTRSIQPLTYFIKITNLTKIQALSIERKIHNMKGHNKKYSGLIGSLLCIGYLMDNRIIKHSDLIYFNLSNYSQSDTH